MINAITGADNHLRPYLEEATHRAKAIRLIVAFVMESGVKIILPHLVHAAYNGVNIKLLTGRYLSVTEPSALYLLIDKLGCSIDVRFYEDSIRSFHPKSYIFDYDDESEVFVGSSNLSLSALTDGIEWNYRFYKSEHPDDYQRFSNMFDELFENCSQPVTHEVLKDYALHWKKPVFDRTTGQKVKPDTTWLLPEPRGAQIEALYYLKQARLEGVDRGLVVAATGVGKTYLAAFDALHFNKVLFLAHRDEILQQAYDTFRSLRPDSHLGFFTGGRKDEGADIYFSTVQTLSREDNLVTFSPDSFDYIIVDEFHHAAADSYRTVIEYFEPNFLLGLTATPFRMDNKDIFAFCNDNVIYEISLKQAIERDLLVPFRYYAIFDPTDYDHVRMVNGRYVAEDLERELSHKSRADLILSNYQNLAKKRTLAFCVSIKHAEYMAQYFSEHGIESVAVHSGVGNGWVVDRGQAIELLEKGMIKVIFAVDIFNEGVDIPAVDTVMFLRPTESYVIFLQQLGRGLRMHEMKDYLTVIDFIGNYKRAHYIPLLLAGENPWTTEGSWARRPDEFDFPEGCQINFDFRIIDLFKELAARDPLPIRMRDIYWRLKQKLDRRPTRVDIYEGSDIPIREFLRDGWLAFLQSVGELDPEEVNWLGTPAEEFLIEIEKTRMTKAYKVPTIMSFVKEGNLLNRVALEDIGANMLRFYRDYPLHQKDMSDRSSQRWREWDVKEFTRRAKDNPVKYLSQGRFFHYDEINRVMYLDTAIEPYLSPRLAVHVKDIMRYRSIDYFRKRFKD